MDCVPETPHQAGVIPAAEKGSEPNTGSGHTFWRVHLITGERVEFRCTQMRVRPDPLILGKEFADEAGGTESHSDSNSGGACVRGQRLREGA